MELRMDERFKLVSDYKPEGDQPAAIDQLAQGVREGGLQSGTRVLMTGMGAGLTWGSAYTVWGNGTA